MAAHRCRQRVNLLPFGAQQDLATLLQCADNLAWTNRWTYAARAWILAKLLFEWSDSGGKWYPDMGQQRQMKILQLRQKLGTMYEEAVRADIREMLAGDAVLRRIQIARCNAQRTAWNPTFFTDPKQHNVGSFCYLIHGMCPIINLTVPDEEGPEKNHLFTHYGTFLAKNGDLSVAELYLLNPGFIQLEVLSCSLIDQDHTTTYRDSPFGLILKAPSGNICNASSTDMSAASTQNMARGSELIGQAPLTALMQVDRFLRLICGAYERPLPSPSEVLHGSDAHNEVLVLGQFASDVVTICGIFIKVTPAMKILQSFVDMDTGGCLTNAMLHCSSALNIPIIPIIEKKGTGSRRDFTYSVPMGLTVGRSTATWRDENVTREYDYHAISRRAGQLLLGNGNNPLATHHVLHDEGIPHQVIEEILGQMGYEGYL